MGEFRETGGGDEGVEYNIKITKKNIKKTTPCIYLIIIFMLMQFNTIDMFMWL